MLSVADSNARHADDQNRPAAPSHRDREALGFRDDQNQASTADDVKIAVASEALQHEGTLPSREAPPIEGSLPPRPSGWRLRSSRAPPLLRNLHDQAPVHSPADLLKYSTWLGTLRSKRSSFAKYARAARSCSIARRRREASTSRSTHGVGQSHRDPRLDVHARATASSTSRNIRP